MINIACKIGDEYKYLSTTNFHSGEFIIPKFDYKKCDEIEVQCFYDNDADITALLLLGAHLREIEQITGDIELFIPYIPYSRMDRFTEKEYEQFTALKSLLSNFYYNNIYTVDLHNPSTDKGIEVIDDLINYNFVNNYDAIILPDKTAFLRYTNKFGFDKRMVVFDKIRKDGEIISQIVFNNTHVLDKNFLIVDDICSRGGTFVNAAKLVKETYTPEVEVNIDLLVTHTENGVFTGELFEHIRKLYTTDSILTENNLLRSKIIITKLFRTIDKTYII